MWISYTYADLIHFKWMTMFIIYEHPPLKQYLSDRKKGEDGGFKTEEKSKT